MTHYVTDANGRWIHEDYARLAEIINDYESTLELRFIPESARDTPEEKANPYMIYDTLHHTPVFTFGDLDLPQDVLVKLWLSDTKYNDPLARIEAQDAARKVIEQKKWLEKLEEATDITKSMIGSPLHTYRYNGKKFDHQRRVIS